MTARRLLLFLFLLPLGYYSFGQENNEPIDTAAIYNMSLEELLKLKQTAHNSALEALINSIIGVSSKKPLSLRKSPSIISLITSEEISRSGARDLIDVLRLVPGFDFGVDVQGIISVGIRGNWAHEGKVLLLLDGQEQNEILYSNIAFGNHYSVDQIKKIEIIRGPGSAIYGGFAEYAVINIITKDGEDINGVYVSGLYGQMQNTYGRRNLNIAIGKKYNDFNFSIAGLLGQGMRSDRDYTDIYGGSYNLSGNSELNPTSLNLGLSYKEFSLRAIYDNYRTTSQDASDVIFSRSYQNDFKSYFLELKYNLKVGDKLTITPKFNYKKQWPWHMSTIDSVDAIFGLYQKSAERYRGNLTLSYDLRYNINLIAGGELFYDKAKTNDDSVFFNNDETSIAYLNTALFAQALFKNRFFNLTLGARYDHNNAYGHAFVPRAGITKKINKWNFKALYSHAFRAPGIENINNADMGEIKPEISKVFEFEAGYQLSRSMYLTANIFDITTKNPIIYSYDTASEAYKNYPSTGTRGIEVEYKAKGSWGYVNLNYTYYTAAGKKKVPQYEVPEVSGALLGLSQHRANLNSSFNVYKKFFVSPSASLMGKRYGYDYSAEDTLGTGMLLPFKGTLLFNLFVGVEDLFGKGLNIGAGCYNILDENYRFIQPYNSGHAPLPGPSREFVVKIWWNINCTCKKDMP
jgi:outer membrane receptor for ferrienterochelin and colicin